MLQTARKVPWVMPLPSTIPYIAKRSILTMAHKNLLASAGAHGAHRACGPGAPGLRLPQRLLPVRPRLSNERSAVFVTNPLCGPRVNDHSSPDTPNVDRRPNYKITVRSFSQNSQQTLEKDIGSVLSNSFGFGGTNASLVLSKY